MLLLLVLDKYSFLYLDQSKPCRFPVPLSLEVIQSRLENNYYRSEEAVRHDIGVMLSNAESYFGKNADLLAKMKRLSEWFTKALSSL